MMLHMAKEMFSNRIDSDLTDALKLEALSESRSVANMLEWILRERYSGRRTVDLVDGAGRFVESVDVSPTAVLTERGASGADVAAPQVVVASTARVPEAMPRSVSAAVPPVVHDVPMRQQARDLALRDGKCSADVARGTKCKLCGKVHP